MPLRAVASRLKLFPLLELPSAGAGAGAGRREPADAPWNQPQLEQQLQQQQQQQQQAHAPKDRPGGAVGGIGSLLGTEGNDGSVKRIIGMGISPPKARGA